jgi:glycosyltransferase involved in cell wall biosynthesis
VKPSRSGRILFDISSSMRWTGPPAGIVRVERKLGSWAHANLPDVAFVFFDPERLAYCEVTCDVSQFLTGEAALDTLGLTDPARPGRRRTDRVPAAWKSAFLWIGQTRRKALNRLEKIRLGTQHLWLARLADLAQRRLMSGKYHSLLVQADDTRRPFFPLEMAVGSPINFEQNDTLVCVGCGWGHTNIGAIGELKSRIGFRMVLLCHDLIPLMFPYFYRSHDVELFGNYMHKAFRIADRIVVNSRAIEADCRAYCMRHGIVVGDIALGSLGFDVDAARMRSVAGLPSRLRAGQFAMMVSTIEPRKGHRLIYEVWRRLVAEGVPQARGFKLVFVGRPGWMVEDLLLAIRDDPDTAEQIVLIHDADDDLLNTLYRDAAFCVYPSAYEGYGLPLIEAFGYGKAVLASTGGALPELARGFSPCLDPTDERAWYDTIRQWIEFPQIRDAYERTIRERFRHPSWSEAAASFFAGILAATNEPDLSRY